MANTGVSQQLAEGVGFVPKIAIFCAILAQFIVLRRTNTSVTPNQRLSSTFTDTFTDSFSPATTTGFYEF
jgi:hypothetical protein